ncbi:16S rRNA (cytidine(1402)-2'-O)-methyltransferase [Paramagnetospirillum caucaseum]|nr:16S rRNA (cytidine(1402)-2'-O)-methyltransferase [Paramagnetospirillum caucaseum]
MAGQRRSAGKSRNGAREPSSDDGPGAMEPGGDTEAKGRPWARGSKPSAGLYLVATPIGNLGDITLRALEVLGHADLVACEDTRVTGRLMQLLGLKAPLTPYHDHNADKARPALLARLGRGEVVALVSDAGTPMVSDPGFKLVRECIESDIPVTALPGASAVLTALQLSGIASERFLFAGFLPSKGAARRGALQELAQVPATLVFYESPHRTGESLADMVTVLGDRTGAVTRELTKLHEEVARGPLTELAAKFASIPPRGEVAIVVSGPGAAMAGTPQDMEGRLRAEVENGLSIKDAAALVAAETGHPRRDVYATALRLFRGGNEE